MTEKSLKSENIASISQVKNRECVPKSVGIAGQYIDAFTHPMQMASQHMTR
jgi:hypothetical protein